MAQYSGIFTTTQQMQADAANNWAATPGAPTSVTATAGSGNASVAFTAPSSAGIPAVITGYIVTSSPGGITATGSSSPITVSGLTNGTAYTFTVQAINASGTGPASAASNSVTPSPSYIEDVFSTYLYTGNGSTQTITNGIDLAGKGGLVWIKQRNAVIEHFLYDTIRGALNVLESNSTTAAYTASNTLTAFDSTGFTLGSSNFVNGTTSGPRNYASWTFRKQAKFFDVVTYTGNGVAGREISHNLGSAPGCIIIKAYSGANADVKPWAVYHRILGAGNEIFLNTTGAYESNTLFPANPTSTVFSVNGDSPVNGNGLTYVAYLFAHNAGGFGAAGTDNVITCGGFTNTTGNSVNLGYEPQWLLIKSTTVAQNWYVIDNMRGWQSDGYASWLSPNTTSEDVIPPGNFGIGLTSTGFTSTSGNNNAYIYIAIRRGPMATPTTGTSVFSPIQQTPSSTPNTYTTNFPVDMVQSVCNNRSVAGNLYLFDRLRGSTLTTQGSLSTNTAGATDNSFAKGFGFDYNTGISETFWNNLGPPSPTTYYNFRRAPNFFDEVCYSGNSSIRTLNHNLGVAPELMIVKDRTNSRSWMIYNATSGANYYMTFSSAGGVPSSDSTIWDNTSPTSSVFTVGTATEVNATSENYVAYLFATCAGVSKVGSYTGNASTQTINCGFGASGARFVLVKSISAVGSWFAFDSANGLTSGSSPYIKWNQNQTQTTGDNGCYASSTGFTLTSAGSSSCNENGVSYIYLAIA